MASSHRPSPLRLSDTAWVTTDVFDPPLPPAALGSSSRDLVPAPRPSDLQIVLRTRDHAAYYDPSSNELSLQKRPPPNSAGSPESSLASNDARLVRHPSEAAPNHSIIQRFTRSTTSNVQQAVCPTCTRPWPRGEADPLETDFDQRFQSDNPDREAPSFTAPNYFRLLAQAITTAPSSSSPDPSSSGFNTRADTPSFLPRNRFESASGSSTPLRSGASTPPEPINHSSEAQGYYARFFKELKRLGRGARGQVFLCQHVLNGNKLGKYAIKKIPVGDHAQSLLQSLNEVHLMETLHHPHLIHYQHAWIERCQLSKFAPEVPTLFVLMMAANGGSLADWISARAGDADAAADVNAESGSPRTTGSTISDARNHKADTHTGDAQKQDPKQGDVGTASGAERLKIERLKAALRKRRASRSTTAAPASVTSPASRPSAQIDMEIGVHLLREDEIYSLLTDMTSGLAFLHDRGILHLDIKPGNVLLHWDEDSLIPRAMLSDFGSSLLLHDNWTRTRSGHTGTMEYMSPETILVNPLTGRLDELSSKADIWSLGMILHLLLFFTLPFSQVEDVDALRREMAAYKGFERVDAVAMGRRSDGVLLGLLERMLQVDPVKRPSCGEVLKVLAAAKAKSGPQEKDSWKRKGRGGEDDDTANRGVSLALYRPSALPLLPSSSTSSAPRHISPHSQSTVSWPPFSLSRRLPPETDAVLIAFLKCLSPALLSHILSIHRPAATTTVNTALLPANAPSLLVLVLALIGLTAQGSQRQGVRRACWAGHLVLLVWLALGWHE